MIIWFYLGSDMEDYVRIEKIGEGMNVLLLNLIKNLFSASNPRAAIYGNLLWNVNLIESCLLPQHHQ